MPRWSLRSNRLRGRCGKAITATRARPPSRSMSACISLTCELTRLRRGRASRLLLTLIKQLLPVVESIAEYDKVIADLFLTHEDLELFSSLPRAGKRLAPRLLAEIGDDRSRYADAASLQALAGTAPVAFQSGNYAKAHKRYACLKPLRNALYQFAWQSTLQEPWALTYYQRKRAEGKSHTM